MPAGPRAAPRVGLHAAPAEEIGRQFDAIEADLGLATDAYLAALTAGGPAGAADEAAQLQVYIVQRVQQMTQDLVTYFNRLPVDLPRVAGPYREHRARNAIQRFLGDQLIGTTPTSLTQSLLAIPVPTGGGPALALYEASLTTTLEASRQGVFEGVRLTFAGRDVLGHGTTTPTIPAR